MSIRGSIHDDAENKLSSTLRQLLDFVFMVTRVACPPQNAFSICRLPAVHNVVGYVEISMLLYFITHNDEKAFYDVCS